MNTNSRDNLDRAQTAVDNGQATTAAAYALIDIARTLRGIEAWCNNNHFREATRQDAAF